jgi:hypothetical protein
MTGPSFAPLIIPIAGTLFLAAWLTVVFYAGRRPRGAVANPAPGRESPVQAALAGPHLPGAEPTETPGPATTRLSAPRQSGDDRVIFGAER